MEALPNLLEKSVVIFTVAGFRYAGRVEEQSPGFLVINERVRGQKIILAVSEVATIKIEGEL